MGNVSFSMVRTPRCPCRQIDFTTPIQSGLTLTIFSALSRGEQSRTSCVVSKAGHFKLQHRIYHAQLEERLHRLRSAALFRKSSARDHAVRFAQAGERRRRVCELQLAAPSVATRNGLALPARTGVSRIPRQKSFVLLCYLQKCPALKTTRQQYFPRLPKIPCGLRCPSIHMVTGTAGRISEAATIAVHKPQARVGVLR